MKSVCHGNAQVKYKKNYHCTNIFIQAKNNLTRTKIILLVPKNQPTLLVRDIVSLIGNIGYVNRELEKLLGEFSLTTHE